MSREFFFHWGSWCDRDREIGIEIFLPLFTFLQMGQKGGTERLKMGQKGGTERPGQKGGTERLRTSERGSSILSCLL